MANAHPIPKNPRFIDLTGLQFGLWTVLSYSHRGPYADMWHCRCECGTMRVVESRNLRQGGTTNCGCVRKKSIAAANKKRRKVNLRRHDPVYACWLAMRQRCLNKTNKFYPEWGGRGIMICDRWLNGDDDKDGFECFRADMGPRPTGVRYSIERRDNFAGYNPSNCYWATPKEQLANIRRNRIVEFRGQRMIMAHAILASGLSEWVVRKRMTRGWSVERALHEPLQRQRRK